jgi:hypothetical protein
MTLPAGPEVRSPDEEPPSSFNAPAGIDFLGCERPGQLQCRYIPVYIPSMALISIRDLQKLSAKTIGALPGPTTVKSGGRTVALLVPLKAADPDRLAAVLTRAEALAKGRDAAADDAALAPFSEVDPVDWSVEAVRALTAGPARR